MKDYTLIEFNNNSSKKQKSVDCVPSKWIFFDETTKNLKTPFLPPPYTAKKYKEFYMKLLSYKETQKKNG